MLKSTPIPSDVHPKPGLTALEFFIFYTNVIVKNFAYFDTIILSQILRDAGWSSWDIAGVWSIRLSAKLSAGLVLGWISDRYKIRIPILSLSATVVGICDCCIPYVLGNCSVHAFMVLYFFNACFAKPNLCNVWITDWLPSEVLHWHLRRLECVNLLVQTVSFAFGALLYDAMDPGYIFIAYGTLSLVSSITWFYHKDNPFGMKCLRMETTNYKYSIMDGPLEELLPEEGWFFLGWPLFLICILCLSFEKAVVISIWAVGLTYASSKEWIDSYSMIALIPIMIVLLQTVSQMLLEILSIRQIATLLSATALGLVLPSTLGAHNNSFLLIAQYSFMIAASFFIEPVVFSTLILIFNEGWKARMVAIYSIIRNCTMIAGVYVITAAYEFDEQLLMPCLMGCTVLCYVSFLAASHSTPHENVNKSKNNMPFYTTLDKQNDQ